MVQQASAEHHCRGQVAPRTELHPIGDGTLTLSCSSPGSGKVKLGFTGSCLACHRTRVTLPVQLGTDQPMVGVPRAKSTRAEQGAAGHWLVMLWAVESKGWLSLQLPGATRSPGTALPCP